MTHLVLPLPCPAELLPTSWPSVYAKFLGRIVIGKEEGEEKNKYDIITEYDDGM
jgi:hypothetical protein